MGSYPLVGTGCWIDEEIPTSIPFLYNNVRGALIFVQPRGVEFFLEEGNKNYPDNASLPMDCRVSRMSGDVVYDCEDMAWRVFYYPELKGIRVLDGSLRYMVDSAFNHWKDRRKPCIWRKDWELLKDYPVLSIQRGKLMLSIESKPVVTVSVETYEILECVSPRFKEMWNTNKDVYCSAKSIRSVYTRCSDSVVPDGVVEGFIDFDNKGNMWFGLAREQTGKYIVESREKEIVFYTAEEFLQMHPVEFDEMMRDYSKYLLCNTEMHERFVQNNTYEKAHL